LLDATTTTLVDILLHPLEERYLQDIDKIAYYQKNVESNAGEDNKFPTTHFMKKLEQYKNNSIKFQISKIIDVCNSRLEYEEKIDSVDHESISSEDLNNMKNELKESAENDFKQVKEKKIQQQKKLILIKKIERAEDYLKEDIKEYWKLKETSLEDKFNILEKLQQTKKESSQVKDVIKELMEILTCEQENVFMQVAAQKNDYIYAEIVTKILFDLLNYLDEDEGQDSGLIKDKDTQICNMIFIEQNNHVSPLIKAIQLQDEDIFKLLLSNLKKDSNIFEAAWEQSGFQHELKEEKNKVFYDIFAKYVNELGDQDFIDAFKGIKK
jgi:hypothetical protein